MYSRNGTAEPVNGAALDSFLQETKAQYGSGEQPSGRSERGERERERERPRERERERERDRDRDRDYRSSRDSRDRDRSDRPPPPREERGDYRARDRELDNYGGRRDDRRHDDRPFERRDHGRGGYDSHQPRRYDNGPPPRGRDDRRGPPPNRNEYRGGGDGQRGRGEWREGFGSPTRSPTPPGAQPISKRKRRFTAWDVHKQGYEHMTAMQAKASGMFVLPAQRNSLAQQFGAGVAGVGGLSSSDMQQMHQSRQSKRLYIGNIPADCTQQGLTAFMEAEVTKLQNGKPARLKIDLEHNYAFVEFMTPEEATLATQVDGKLYQGLSLKIRRPKEYVGNEEVAEYIPGVVGTVVADTPNKIFIGGLPPYLNDEQVQTLLKAFGELKSFNMIKDGSISKGFAFCEYVDPNTTDVAIKGLNQMELGDKVLNVQRASQNAAENGAPGSSDVPSRPNAAVFETTSEPVKPTNVILMLNMVTADELINDQDYEEILEDIKEECTKYGTVIGVRVPRPQRVNKSWNSVGSVVAPKSDIELGVGRVYVGFETEPEATKAFWAVAGRQFGGRSIICAYATEKDLLTGLEPPPPPEDAPPPVPEDNDPPPPPPED